MNKKDVYKLCLLLIWWGALNVYVWICRQTPFDWFRAGCSAGTLLVIGLLAWLWHKRFKTEQSRRSLDA